MSRATFRASSALDRAEQAKCRYGACVERVLGGYLERRPDLRASSDRRDWLRHLASSAADRASTGRRLRRCSVSAAPGACRDPSAPAPHSRCVDRRTMVLGRAGVDVVTWRLGRSRGWSAIRALGAPVAARRTVGFRARVVARCFGTRVTAAACLGGGSGRAGERSDALALPVSAPAHRGPSDATEQPVPCVATCRVGSSSADESPATVPSFVVTTTGPLAACLMRATVSPEARRRIT